MQGLRSWLGSFGLLPLAVAALEINTATRAELEQLNGVGVAMAERVLNERAKAPFRDWDDLQRRVKGIAGARIERLQAQAVTVNGIAGSRGARDGERKRRTYR
jgi:competence protein ComEA